MKLQALATAIVFAAVSTALFSGCTTSANSGVVFGRDETLHAQNVLEGTVTDVRYGKIEGTKSGAGTLAGGAMGAVVGNLFGGGKGNTIATVGGAVAGALAGAGAEENLTSKNGIQITVRLDNGQTVVIVQEADVTFQPGERVRVLTRPGAKDRVQKLM